MRAFIGVDFSKQLKSEISELQKELRIHTKSGRWKYVDNFHLTLKFLAEVNDRQLNDINRIMKEICLEHDAFALNISEIGFFPGRGSLRVVWLGLGGDLGILKALQGNIENSLISVGFDKENREYKPHVTIGQDLILDIEFSEVKNLVHKMKFSEIKVDSIYMFKSEQIANKRVYTPINEYMLKQK
jgi:RNA 2',3'-cyclic 3'-phosphodiesterase